MKQTLFILVLFTSLAVWNYGAENDALSKFEFFRKLEAAKQGDIQAQYFVGRAYKNGWGVIKDDTDAVKWYHKAADQGHARAQSNLGNMYREGKGVKQDYEKAVELFSKAAEQGLAGAQSSLGVMYLEGYGVEKDHQEALKWGFKYAREKEKMYDRDRRNTDDDENMAYNGD